MFSLGKIHAEGLKQVTEKGPHKSPICDSSMIIALTFEHPLPGISSVQSLSPVWLFATPWIAAGQASLSITNSRSLLKLMPIESVMPSSHLILCHPLLLLPSIPPSIRVFSSESNLCMRWPKYWSFYQVSDIPNLTPTLWGATTSVLQMWKLRLRDTSKWLSGERAWIWTQVCLT